MKRHILLIGLPGAGKSSVGRLVAARLGAPFLDGDAMVEACVGKSVARIFAEDGETAFREHERAVVTNALAGEPAVIAPGGGWAVQPSRLDAVAGALVMHLEVGAESALARLGGAAGRPLLAEDPGGAMEQLAAVRLPLYRKAELTVQTEGRTVSQVADLVSQLARAKGGW